MKKIEITLAILCVVSVIAKALFLPLPGIGLFMTLSFFLLAVVYQFWSRSVFMDVPLSKTFKKDKYPPLETDWETASTLSIAAGIILSLALYGLLFIFMLWPGGILLLLTAVLLFSTFLLINVILYSQTRCAVYSRIIKRLSIVGGIGLLLILLSPHYTWLDIQYRNYPAYVEAARECRAYPDNLELQIKENYEWDKIHNPARIEDMKKRMYEWNKTHIPEYRDSVDKIANELGLERIPKYFFRPDEIYFKFIKEDSINGTTIH